MQKILPYLFCVLFYGLISYDGQAQTTIASDGFENALSIFTITTGTGTFYSGNSTAADRPASSPFAVENTYSFAKQTGSVTITSNDINTSIYTSVQLALRAASFSIGVTNNGADAGDIIKIEVSPDGGTTYYNTLQVAGNSNAYWAYAATGTASTPYDGNITPVVFAPAGGGSRTTDGYSTITITSLPAVTNLKIRISLTNDAAQERWAIDDFKVTGILSTVPIITTPTATNFTTASADLGGNITYQGATAIIERGTVYKTTAGVTITDNKLIEGGTATGVFSQTQAGLNPQTQYFYKAYATNSNGTSLTSEASFYTLSNPPLSEVTNFNATPVSTDEIDLTWLAATFPATGATAKGYIILYATNPTFPTIGGVTNGVAPASLSLTYGSLLTTINSGGITTYNNTGLSANTQYNYMIIPFTWDGVNGGTYNYYTTNAATAVALTFVSGPTDYYISRRTGPWNQPSTWKSSVDGVNYFGASAAPTSSASQILIKPTHTITITSPSSANALKVEGGAVLIQNTSVSFNIQDGAGAEGTGIDLIVDGNFEMNGEAPTFLGNAKAEIRSGGTVKVTDNTGGQSDDFARYTNVSFKTGSRFDWSTTNAFEAGGSTSGAVSYFQGAGYTSEKPIFRINSPVGFIGGTNNLTINGKLEVMSTAGANVLFKNTGLKIFRDGLGGDGKITHASGSGTFQITSPTAVIDGSLILNLDDGPGTDLDIMSTAKVALSGSVLINVGSAGSPGSDLVINGTLTHTSTNPVDLTYGNLTIKGYIAGFVALPAGTFSAAAASGSVYPNISITGTTGDNVGTLALTSGKRYVNTLSINRTGSGAKLIMGTDVITKNISLFNGIIATGNNLFTWDHTGSFLGSETGYTQNSINYNKSYVCTCDAAGIPLATTNGTKGFRINNVGNTDVYFPVGADFISANRMMINNSGTADNFTVVVNKGDIGNTPKPVVERIWYVNELAPGGSSAAMKLFFTKRDPQDYPTLQDEVESGFDFTDMHLVQKNYINNFVNVASNSDVLTASPASYNEGTEMYGQYTSASGAAITGFTRFAIVNQSTFVLPVKIVNFVATIKNSAVQLDFTCLNETGVDHYEIQRSSNGTFFTTLGKIISKNNSTAINYNYTDAYPLNGNNLYRIKAVDKDGKLTYTSVINIVFGLNAQGISIYPNPVISRNLNLQFANLPAANYEITIHNALGQLIVKKLIAYTGGTISQNIQLPFLSTGKYPLTIRNDNQIIYSQQLLINNTR